MLAEQLTVHRCRSLRSLSLTAGRIGDQGAVPLLEALVQAPYRTTLTFLDLSQNKIGTIGASQLARSLGLLSQVKTVKFDSNPIGAGGAKKIAESVGSFKQVTALHLSHCGIGNDGIRAFAVMLSFNLSLIELDLSYNQLSERAGLDLETCLNLNTSLVKLNLDGNQLGDEASKAIGQRVSRWNAPRKACKVAGVLKLAASILTKASNPILAKDSTATSVDNTTLTTSVELDSDGSARATTDSHHQTNKHAANKQGRKRGKPSNGDAADQEHAAAQAAAQSLSLIHICRCRRG
eukprot:TRINITY_DN60770_c0_g1_i1.p1 TRINITY_DN60770_c0_g1~~TRINITY_DN60770_c0_g1_i1.p1  ORF type:complete len:293 (-),score=64.32 TRINITY_DN60770_c0_g1_i1:8-886(-)